jgi:hypothetical protein
MFSANFPSTSSQTSLLRTALDLLLNAVLWNANQTTTTDEILANPTSPSPANSDPANDVIVKVSSQVNNQTPLPIMNVEHSGFISLAWDSVLNLVGLSDQNVLNCPAVSALVLCYVLSAGTANCAVPVNPNPATPCTLIAQQSNTESDLQANIISSEQKESEQKSDANANSKCIKYAAGIRILPDGSYHEDLTPEQIEQNKQVDENEKECEENAAESKTSKTKTSAEASVKPFGADFRVDVIAPSKPVFLAEENEIELQVHAPGLSSVWIEQKRELSEETFYEMNIAGGSKELPILHHADGSAYINVIPMRLGKLEIRFLGSFKDGGVFSKSVILDVQPPERSPKKLLLEDMNLNSGMRILLMDRNPGSQWLTIHAIYDKVKEPIRIDPQAVTFNIRSNDATPPFDLSQTGIFTPHRVGHALVEATYGGLTSLVCVVVQPAMNVENHDNCKELYQPGEIALPKR